MAQAMANTFNSCNIEFLSANEVCLMSIAFDPPTCFLCDSPYGDNWVEIGVDGLLPLSSKLDIKICMGCDSMKEKSGGTKTLKTLIIMKVRDDCNTWLNYHAA